MRANDVNVTNQNTAAACLESPRNSQGAEIEGQLVNLSESELVR